MDAFVGLHRCPENACMLSQRNSRCAGWGEDNSMTEYTGSDDRRSTGSNDRRKQKVDRRAGLDRRRGPGRRRGEVRRAAEEGELSDDLLEFVMVVDDYKRINDRPYPTISQISELVHYLGYRKVAERSEHINTAAGPADTGSEPDPQDDDD